MYSKFILFSLLSLVSFSLTFKSELQPTERRCFYEIFNIDQKYKIDIQPLSNNLYQLLVQFKPGDGASTLLYKKDMKNGESAYVHKLASHAGLHQICLWNFDAHQKLSYKLSIQHGVELMELHLLPDKTDAENFEKQVKWLEQEKKALKQMIQRHENLEQETREYSDEVSLQMSIITIVLTVLIFGINGYFYVKFRKSLRQRKLI